MNTQLQESIWPFITAFRRQTGIELSYLELLRDPAALSDALNRALASGDPRLVELASQLQTARTASAAVTRGNASIGVPHASGEDTGAGFSTTLDQNQKRVLDRFTEVLSTEGGITYAGRSQLDAYCAEFGVRRHVAERIEREIRRERRLPHQNWKAEYVDALEIMITKGRLTSADRMRLRDTYVESGRLTEQEAGKLEAALLGDEPAQEPGEGIEISTPLIGAMAAGLIVLALVFGLPLLFSADDSDSSPQVAQATIGNAAPAKRIVSGSILESTIWRADTTYVLDEVIFVEAGAQLTIEPGTTILGNPGSALVVTRHASIYARGSAESPIVFSSSKAPGQRKRGDWGGVVLLGAAPINRGRAQIEGIAASDPRGQFGGAQAGHNCGTLQYVRIEFAGYEVFANNELNGLTLGGCGNKSIIRYVQVHKALDDGIELFGGDVDLRNAVVTGARDDSFDWDMGWTGRVQFLVIQQHADAGDNGFEADSNKQDHNAEPRSLPTFYNVTMLGSGSAEKAQRAMTLRRGTGGLFRNFIVAGFRKESIDVRDTVSAALARTGKLALQNSILFDIGADGRSYFSDESGEKDDDGGFDEAGFLRSLQHGNRFDVDPMFKPAVANTEQPDFAPQGNSPALLQAASQPEDEFWDQGADFIGAIRPGLRRDWTADWTAYPTS